MVKWYRVAKAVKKWHHKVAPAPSVIFQSIGKNVHSVLCVEYVFFMISMSLTTLVSCVVIR
jgi:hypothetical protein